MIGLKSIDRDLLQEFLKECQPFQEKPSPILSFNPIRENLGSFLYTKMETCYGMRSMIIVVSVHSFMK